MGLLRSLMYAFLMNSYVIPMVLGRCPPATEPPSTFGEFYAGNSNSLEDEAGKQWLEHGGFCYRYVASPHPWYPAEQVCRLWGGHLASIRTVEENRLIGRLTGCQSVWIGRFATDFHRVAEPETYEWTEDEVAAGEQHNSSAVSGSYYSSHNVTTGSITDRHAGALRAESLSWINTHYHERLPFVCKTVSSLEGSERCAAPLSQFNDHCYWLSDFATSFVDASLHCERELGGHLASVHSPAEARFIASLELDRDTCQLSNVWIGLIRQSPCRRSGNPVESGQPCYQWTDFSGEHTGYPHWAGGHPLDSDNHPGRSSSGQSAENSGAWSINCVTLSGEGLRSERCYSRRRFVCKVEAGKSIQRAPELNQPSPTTMTTEETRTEQPTTIAVTASVEEPGVVSAAEAPSNK